MFFLFLDFGIYENWNLSPLLSIFLGFSDNCVDNLSALSRNFMGI